MNRFVCIGERKIEIRRNGEEDILEVEPCVYSILTEGRSYEARLTSDRSGWTVEISGTRYPVEVFDPRDRRRGSSTGHWGGRRSVKSPMPGKVVRMLVAEGDAVESGQGLLVVEAMKMQNEIKSPKKGKLVQLRVKAGDTVAAGDVLAAVE